MDDLCRSKRLAAHVRDRVVDFRIGRGPLPKRSQQGLGGGQDGGERLAELVRQPAALAGGGLARQSPPAPAGAGSPPRAAAGPTGSWSSRDSLPGACPDYTAVRGGEGPDAVNPARYGAGAELASGLGPRSHGRPGGQRLPWPQCEERRRDVLLAAVSLAGCASVHNYLEPEGPRYAGGPSPVPTASPRADGSLRVVSFNVAYAKQIPEAIAALRADPLRGADVITLQEMDAPGTAAIAEALGLNYVYYPGVTSFDRPRLRQRRVVSLAHRGQPQGPAPRLQPGHAPGPGGGGGLGAGGRPRHHYLFRPLTSPWGMGGGGRARQVEAILADAGERDPVVIAGDFNSHGVGERILARGFLWPTRKIGHSIGPFSYDHIFVRGLRLGGGRQRGRRQGRPEGERSLAGLGPLRPRRGPAVALWSNCRPSVIRFVITPL